ncbi:DNA mismatch repair protein msh3 [Exophiala mesophila]|uniref:DNA mismatch repair protein n=1 Tax=Exophiala mesophila TaxID=212818 RepID=A0A438MYM7_EXOME|nr:DNA mismatch repair protein msh3 [Exophiala mesophila]
MASSQKKQQTLSSFFKKPSQPPSSPAPPVVSRDQDHDDDDDDVVKPSSKRRKVTPANEELVSPALLDASPADLNRTLRPVVANGQKSIATSSPSDRTSRYVFDSSPLQENQNNTAVDSFEQKKKDELHLKFVRKLGKPDSIADIKRRNRFLEDNFEEQDDEADSDAAEEPPKPIGKTKPANKKSSTKLTPMEKQVIDIKQKHMDTLLVVEVGYKFRFFGEDARVAAKELGIVCIPGKYRFDEHPSEAHLDRFASASIPVHRLHVHVKRLVSAGHKVGVVRQLETAALKAAGDNRNAPFVRKLTNLYTKGTYIDDIEGLEEANRASPVPQSPSTGFLLCLTEVNVKGYGNDEKVHVGVVAVQPATGDVVYDDFEDGFMRSEIETRLLHIAPSEFLIVGELSRATEKLVQHLSGSKTNVFGDKIRVERVSKDKTMAAQAHNHISSFYADRLKDSQSDSTKASGIFDKILGLPENVSICLSAMIKHLSDYGLEHVFQLAKYFQPFSARSHMLLNGNTLTSLEIYQNQTDYSTKGSLCWMMDRTQTRFGGRLLRKWVGRPLLDKQIIEDRLNAVEELNDPAKSVDVEKLRRVLSSLRTDLEKSLLRIYYGKCTRPELLNVLQSFQMLSGEFAHITGAESTGFRSTLISEALTPLPLILTEIVKYLDMVNLHAAKEDDKYNFFQEEFETEKITEHRFGIISVEHDLDQFRGTAAEKLGKKAPVKYATVAGIDYLIEVENSSATIKKVPASWAKISGTKKVSRFHPPEVVKLIRERDQHKESLAANCDAAYKNLLADISNNSYQRLRDTIQSLATLDCLLSLANVASQPGYVRPSFTDTTNIDIAGARHPMVEQLLIDAYVPNNVSLSQSATRALLVTGPNMGGKSSYVRSVALIVIMAQIGSFVPADSASLGILDAVFTRMGAFDNMMSGESTFMVELSETSDILKLATDRSLVVLDELGRGTSTHDGVAIAASVLDFLIREKKCLTLFITHYQMLSRMADGFSNGELKNVHMQFTEDRDGDGEKVTFLYEVGEGVAHRSYGLNVARLANVGEGVIDLAREKSRELEIETKKRQLAALAGWLTEENGTMENRLDALVEGIDIL